MFEFLLYGDPSSSVVDPSSSSINEKSLSESSFELCIDLLLASFLVEEMFWKELDEEPDEVYIFGREELGLLVVKKFEVFGMKPGGGPGGGP